MQQIFKGINELDHILKQFDKVLIVHGKSFEGFLVKSSFDVFSSVHFTDFTPNPQYKDVCKGIDLFNAEKCEAIIAVGGGSAIDVAKCIKLFCRMDRNTNYLQQEKTDTKVPLAAVPTTAGTGSESTRYAVIYYEGEKQSISHPSIIPDYVFLVPSFLKNLPVYQKKCTMLDALCQAIESWWSVNSTDQSVGYSRKAISLIVQNWEEYIFDNTILAAEKIMEAANYAGRAINITATTAAHAMSYKITSMYKLPHGHAVAVCMPEVWSYMLEHTESCIDGRGVDYLKNTLSQIAGMMDLPYFKTMIQKLEMGCPTASDRETESEILAQSVNPVRLKNNPVPLSTDVLKEMYGRILK